MPKEPNTRLIGIFMISGMLVLIATFLVYLRDEFFVDDGKMVVMYFEESINGLNVGSPVVFKGVQIGKVVAIDLVANAKNLEFSIPVYAKIEQRKGRRDDTFKDRLELLNRLISEGLRARLTTQSFLTGMLMIELEILPGTPVVLKHGKKEDVLEIPTVLSPMGELSKGLQDLPIQKSVEEFNKFFVNLNAEMPNILSQVNKIMANIGQAMSTKSGASADTIVNFNKALNNISDAARAVRNLADYLERHPEAVLKGKKGAY